MTREEFCVLYCHFYITSIYLHEYRKENKNLKYPFSIKLILISWMNTFDNLYNLLTIIINKRRCSSDEKKTNDQCPEHCMTIWCILKYLLLLLLWSI
jgi:hypothetical protein